jgi:hypothetical protein
VSPLRRAIERLGEKAYRDVWLFLVSAFVVLAVIVARNENNGRIADIQSTARASAQQNVSARYDACVGANRLRAALRQDVRDGQRQAPLLYKLLPQLDTPEIRKLSATGAAKKLKAYAAQDCVKVALAVVPPNERYRLHVP